MSNSNFSHQVSTKESDIGIGQSVFGSYHDEVDYLDYMYERQIVMLSGKPRPIVTYDTIIHPFDVQTWVFTSIFMMVDFTLLIVMQIMWSHVSRKPLASDFTFRVLNRKAEGFKSRDLVILKCLVLGNVITMAYKSTLLSSLITVRYENPIDTLVDLERSGLPVLLPNNTPLHTMFATDPRRIIQTIYNNSFVYNFNTADPMSMPIWEM